MCHLVSDSLVRFPKVKIPLDHQQSDEFELEGKDGDAKHDDAAAVKDVALDTETHRVKLQPGT